MLTLNIHVSACFDQNTYYFGVIPNSGYMHGSVAKISNRININ